MTPTQAILTIIVLNQLRKWFSGSDAEDEDEELAVGISMRYDVVSFSSYLPIWSEPAYPQWHPLTALAGGANPEARSRFPTKSTGRNIHAYIHNGPHLIGGAFERWGRLVFPRLTWTMIQQYVP